MGSPPGTISLSRWFPLKSRGTMYSIFSSTPSFGKALTMIALGFVVAVAGWQWGFVAAAAAGVIGTIVAAVFISDTPESKGLPTVQELSGEPLKTLDKKPTKELQKWVFRHPGIWVIAISSAFIYITQHAVSDWGVLFLQKQKDFSLESATQIIGISEAFAGALTVVTLSLFLFTGGTYWMNIAYIALFSMAFSVVFCIVAGLMALDFVPRKATGAALGIVGISSYAAAGLQSIVSGFLIEGNAADGVYNFGPVSIFWTIACVIAFVLPVIGWKYLRVRE